MGWRKAQPSDREALIGLLKQKEWEHLHFSSELKGRSRFKLTGQGSLYILRSEGHSLKGGVFFSGGGALHGCFEPKDLTQSDIDQLEALLKGRTFFSFIGRSDRVNLFEELYGSKENHEVNYYLYELSQSKVSSDIKTLEGIDFRLARLSDFKELYFLEEAYQKEEVMRNPDQLNERFLKRKFYKQLTEEIIWIGKRKNRIIAKGGTNAMGFEYCQLGGIYTVPQERSQGIGEALLSHLTVDLKSKGWGSALFVRKDNPTAIALYKKCGYEKKGDFRIVYPHKKEEN